MIAQRSQLSLNAIAIGLAAVSLWQFAPDSNALGYAAYFIGLPRAFALLPGASPGMHALFTVAALFTVGIFFGVTPYARNKAARATVEVALLVAALLLPPLIGYGEAALSHTYMTASLPPHPTSYIRTIGDRMSHRADGMLDRRGIIISWMHDTYVVVPVDLQTSVVDVDTEAFVSIDKAMIDDVRFDALHVQRKQ